MSAGSTAPRDDTYDVIVAGAGPAGCAAATLVAAAGRKVLLLDRETFPRPRVGESLMPATYPTLQRMGMLESMQASAFPRKHSVQFFAADGRSGLPFYFSEICDDESAVTWQVERSHFDGMLLDNAAAHGAEVVQRANVKDVLFDGSRATGVRVELAGGETRELSAGVVVDASGQTALIARKLGLKQNDPKLRHVAYYTRFLGARRGEGIDEGATIIMHTRRPRVWFWYIPLPDDEISVGVVGPLTELVEGRNGGPQAVFDEEAANTPHLLERIEGSEQALPVQAIRDFSYVSDSIAGDGWVMAGDAFGFLDPIYSSGVFLALKSGEFAADSILDAFDHQDLSAARLGRHGPRYLEGMEAMRKLVYAYYDERFSFAELLRRHPECRDELVNLLVGNVYTHPHARLFEAMSELCELPEPRTLSG